MAALHKAAIDTPSFSFEAYGATAEEACEALHTGLVKHSEQYRVSHRAEWVEKCMEDVQTLEITLGTCYRDHEPVLHPATPSQNSPTNRQHPDPGIVHNATLVKPWRRLYSGYHTPLLQ